MPIFKIDLEEDSIFRSIRYVADGRGSFAGLLRKQANGKHM
ncbi:hypothetical protein [Labilibaculum filiforme]|nr:hypothetical protein [Labilibaculum filiforme]